MSESVKVSDCRNRRPARDNYPGVIWKPLSSAQVPTVHRKRADDLLLSSVPLQSLKTVMDVSLNTPLPTRASAPLLLTHPPSHLLVFPPFFPLLCTTLALFVPSPLLVFLSSFYSLTFSLFFHSDEDEEEEERWWGGAEGVEVKWRRRFLAIAELSRVKLTPTLPSAAH